MEKNNPQIHFGKKAKKKAKAKKKKEEEEAEIEFDNPLAGSSSDSEDELDMLPISLRGAVLAVEGLTNFAGDYRCVHAIERGLWDVQEALRTQFASVILCGTRRSSTVQNARLDEGGRNDGRNTHPTSRDFDADGGSLSPSFEVEGAEAGPVEVF